MHVQQNIKSFHTKCHTDCRRAEPEPLRFYAGDQLDCANLHYQFAKGLCPSTLRDLCVVAAGGELRKVRLGEMK